jgi:hypothetical protein
VAANLESQVMAKQNELDETLARYASSTITVQAAPRPAPRALETVDVSAFANEQKLREMLEKVGSLAAMGSCKKVSCL